MRIEITRNTSWKDVVNAARFTWNKEPLDREPSEKFKKMIVLAEHSPLRCLMFTIDLYDVPSYVSGHLVRHVHAQPFVATARPDSNSEAKPRDEQKKSDPCNIRLFLNAQEIINISRLRLCGRAEKPTRDAWKQVISKLSETEPELAAACVPNCIYRSLCPESKCCGLFRTEKGLNARKKYERTFCNI